MKKILSRGLALALVLMLILPVTLLTAFADGETAYAGDAKITASGAFSGSGTADDPYKIATAADFLAIASLRSSNGNYKGKYLKLTADIDLNPNWNTTMSELPTNLFTAANNASMLWQFDGTLDGDGHTVRGLCVADNGTGTGTNVWMINKFTATATLKNIKFDNLLLSSVRGTAGNNVALIQTMEAGSTIENVEMTNTCVIDAKGTGAAALMVAMPANSVTVKNIKIAATVKSQGTTNVGGVVASTNGGKITYDNVSFTGVIIAPNCENAPLIAPIKGTEFVTFKNCTAAATEKNPAIKVPSGATPKGNARTFAILYTVGGVDKAFAEIVAPGNIPTSGGEVYVPEGSSGPEYVANADWKVAETLADGTKVYEIASPADLLAFNSKRTSLANYENSIVKLTADIDLNPGWVNTSGKIPPNGWNPFFQFKGTFDGQGHTMSGLYASYADNGSFMQTVLGTVKNVRVENSYFEATNDTAGFIACVKNDTTIENVYVNAVVKAKENKAGGIVGWLYTSVDSEYATNKVTIKNCVFNGTVTAKDIVGGIIGTNADWQTKKQDAVYMMNDRTFPATITDCAVYGTVRATDGLNCGGICGYMPGNATLKNCYVNAASDTSMTVNMIADVPGSGTVTLEDVYYVASGAVPAIAKPASMTAVIKYDGAAADSIAAVADNAELLTKNAFKDTWMVPTGKTFAIPSAISGLFCKHQYTHSHVDSTCCVHGGEVYVCSLCGSTYTENPEPFAAHTPGEWIVDREPTEKAAGSRHQECSVCHAEITREILPKLAPSDNGDEEPDDPKKDDPKTPVTPKEEDKPTEEKGGCGSVIAAEAVLFTVFSVAAVIPFSKKRD